MLRFGFIVVLLAALSAQNMLAQGDTRAECGMIIEDVFTEDFQSRNYSVDMSPGDRITVSGSPLGDILGFTVGVYAPNDALVAVSDGGVYALPSSAPLAQSGVLSAGGSYRITAHNSSITIGSGRPCTSGCNKGGIGVFTLFIGCTLRDGTVINPGDNMPEHTPIPPTAIPTQSPNEPDFFGFRGIQPVNFANAFKLPLSLGAPMPGSIPPVGDAVLGLTFDANAGDTFALDFARTGGNLNLGLVVLSANNEVVFQASLVTSQSLSTRLTLPSAGQYTIGVFRIDLLPPAAPEATLFQITGTLNP